jgi:dynein heavy chain
LSGFTYPTGFLKALQQQQARREQVSIDQYGWEFLVLPGEDKTIMHGAKDGAYIRGVYLEGAGWDADAICLAEPNAMELIVPMPIIHFRPKRREGKLKMKGQYSCPLYMYPVRTGTRERPSFVIGVDVSTGASEPEHWTKRGAALLLSTAD